MTPLKNKILFGVANNIENNIRMVVIMNVNLYVMRRLYNTIRDRVSIIPDVFWQKVIL
jgi:hypothetical protein